MTNLNDIKDLISKYKESKSELEQLIEKEGASIVINSFQEVLKKCPEVVVSWRQGTPAFNDGDPCRFSVHDLWICHKDCDDYDEENSIDSDTGKRYIDGELEENGEVYCSPELQEEIYSVWGQFDSMILENSFGEARVWISADDHGIDEFDWY